MAGAKRLSSVRFVRIPAGPCRASSGNLKLERKAAFAYLAGRVTAIGMERWVLLWIKQHSQN
jgi:hypothetical protein